MSAEYVDTACWLGIHGHREDLACTCACHDSEPFELASYHCECGPRAALPALRGRRMSADEVAGAQRCMFGTSIEDHCGAPAVLHVLQTTGHPTMSCAEHSTRWAVRAHEDLHPIGSTCGLPGMTWIYSGDTPPGFCMIEGLDVPMLATTQEVAA